MKRIFFYDLTKAIAILLVVLVCHACCNLENKESTLGYLCEAIGLYGVPFFVLVSGALVLNKTNLGSRKGFTRFYKHNLLSLWITAEVWIVFYYLLCMPSYDLTTFLRNFLLIDKAAAHLWYIRMIVAYYIILPGIAYLLHHKNKRWILWVLCTISFCLTFGLNAYHMIIGNAQISDSKIVYFSYLIYFVAGYAVSNKFLEKTPLWFLNILSIAMLICLYMVAAKGHASWYLWYDNPLVLIGSITLFELFRRITLTISVPEGLLPRCIIALSKMSFGIYLSHFIIVEMFVKLNISQYGWGDLTLFIVTGFFSLGFSILLMKVLSPFKLLHRILFRS